MEEDSRGTKTSQDSNKDPKKINMFKVIWRWLLDPRKFWRGICGGLIMLYAEPFSKMCQFSRRYKRESKKCQLSRTSRERQRSSSILASLHFKFCKNTWINNRRHRLKPLLIIKSLQVPLQNFLQQKRLSEHSYFFGTLLQLPITSSLLLNEVIEPYSL